MKTRRVTVGLLLVVAAVLVAWDLHAAATPTEGDTISEVLLGWALRSPALAFAFGFLMGHLFWPQRPKGGPDDAA